MGIYYEKSMTAADDFLSLPERTAKPRVEGLTHVLDGGIPLGATADWLSTISPTVDVWKFGWGTAYVDPAVQEKLALLAQHHVRPCVGGTLLEAAWLQGVTEPFLEWAGGLGFASVEVSNGASDMAVPEKRRLIARAAESFEVFAEVGSKDPDVAVSPGLWAQEALGDVAAGATWVIAEGRESGVVGLYHPDGEVREDVVDALVSELGLSRVVFEAPRRAQQAWFLRHYGSNVSLGNVAPSESMSLETLRLGLRADTLGTLSRPKAVHRP